MKSNIRKYCIAFASAVALSASAASAAVTYDGSFTLRFFPNPDQDVTLNVAFNFSTPDYLTSNYAVPVGQRSVSNSFVFDGLILAPNFVSGGQPFDTIFISLFRPDFSTRTRNLGFAPGTFGANGVYSHIAILPGSSFAGTSISSLTISGSPDVVNPVPEPATWAMMLAGFGLIGAGLRRSMGNGHGGMLAAS